MFNILGQAEAEVFTQKTAPTICSCMLLKRSYKQILQNRHICHETVHHNKMTYAAAHHKQMENFVGAEILMSGIENRQFQSINNAAHRIDYAAGQKPSESLRRKGIDNLCKSQNAYPANGDI